MKIFYISFFSLIIFTNMVKNLFFSWCLLETYSLIFLLLIFSFKKWNKKKKAFIYFGMMKLFVGVILIYSLMKDFLLMSFMSMLMKMGNFPLLDWVMNFMKKMSWQKNFLFFSMKKFIPLYLLKEFFNIKVMGILIFFMLKLMVSCQGAFFAQNLMTLIGWSSLGSSAYLVLLIFIKNKFLICEFLLVIYSMLIFYIFYFENMKKIKRFLIMLLLFGMPPLSMFMFKIYFMLKFLQYFSMIWFYFFSFSFMVFGVSYFYVFVKESQKMIFMENFKKNQMKFVIFTIFFLLLMFMIFF